MALSKKFLKTKPVCKVTFRIPDEMGNGFDSAFVVGEFNDWSPLAAPMKKLKGGGFSATLDLDVGREYEFRYLLGNGAWQNDPEADSYVWSEYAGGDNSVVSLLSD